MMRLPRVRVVVAFRAAKGHLARSLTGSMAVHVVLLAAVLVAPATRDRPVPLDDAMVVALVGPIAAALAPGGSSAPAPARAPAPKTKQAAPEVREVPKLKPKEKLVKFKKEPTKPPDVAKQPETPDPDESSTPQADQGPQRPEGPPPASPQAAIGGSVTATVGGGESSLGWYGAAVKAALEAAWKKPVLEDASGTASVVLAFDIARNGTPRNIRIETSSGIQILDRSVQSAVTDAAPFPPVPSAWAGDAIPVIMRFDLSPETR